MTPSNGKSANFDQYLMGGAKSGASDVHFECGLKPYARFHGILKDFKTDYSVQSNHLISFLRGIVGGDREAQFQEEKNLDFSISIHETRYRGNASFDQNGPYLTFRVIPDKIIPVNKIGFPYDVYEDILKLNEGLVLVTGITGCGKTTTLASLMQEINTNKNKRIITIEDPVEYYHKSLRSRISQRELGPDVKTFSDGIKYSLRQDPDIILVGEIRDRDTALHALEASETGHLVFSTVHAKSAEDTIDRYMSLFSANEQEKVRFSLESNLAYVLYQKLVPYQKDVGRTLAMEVMNVRDSAAIKNHIRDGETFRITDEVERGSRLKMVTLDRRLTQLVEEDKILAQDAINNAMDPIRMKRDFEKDGLI